jgi:hypothetical protein
MDVIDLIFSLWFIRADGRITDQGGDILSHKDKNGLLDKVNQFYFSHNDDEIEEINKSHISIKVQSPPKNSQGIVYLLKSANGLYKIGITKNINQRLTTIRKSPIKIELVHSIESGNAADLEKDLHSRFADNRVIGEWFQLNQEQVKEICSL